MFKNKNYSSQVKLIDQDLNGTFVQAEKFDLNIYKILKCMFNVVNLALVIYLHVYINEGYLSLLIIMYI